MILGLLSGPMHAAASASTGHAALDLAYEENRWPDAIREVERIQAAAPKGYASGRLYLLHAWLLEQLDRPAEAAAVYAAWQDKDLLFRDYLLWSRAQALAAAGENAGARQALYELVRAHPTSPYNADAHFQLAESYAAAGKLELARKTFQSYIKKQKKRRPEARLRIARIDVIQQAWIAAGTLLQELLRCGEPRVEAAAAVLLTDQPKLMAQTRAAESRLTSLVRVLVENRESGRALPLTIELQTRFSNSTNQPLYCYWRGRCLFLKGDYPAALAWFQQGAAGNDPAISTQCRFALARTLVLARREAEATPVYTQLLAEAKTNGSRGDVLRALYNITRLTGPSDAARGWLNQGVRTLRGAARIEFSFRLALQDLQLGLPVQAVEPLTELTAKLPAAADGDLPDRSEAVFFLGLAFSASGDDDRALETWTSDVYRWGNYYSFLSMSHARQILARQPARGEQLATAARQRFEESAADGRETDAYGELCRLFFLTGDTTAWMDGVARLPEISARLADLSSLAPLPDGDLALPPRTPVTSPQAVLYRARVFQRLGLAAPAAAEYDRCRLTDIAKAAGVPPGDLAEHRLYTQAWLFARSGSIHRAFTYSHALLRRYPAGTPFDAIHPEVLAWCYPAPFREEVLAACREAAVEPSFVYGIMLQESRCNPRAHSPVAARGLMQLMPETAKEIAVRHNVPLPADPAALYDKALNIRLGVWYVRQLLDRLQHPAPVAAAYNAGQSQSMYWSRLAGKPLDYYFIPEVHFNQTREYVNLVLANRAMYAWLHPDLVVVPATTVSEPATR